jgi:hypothetical protein
MRENLAQLFRKRRLLTIRQLQPGQLRNFFNFLFRYFHRASLPTPRSFNMAAGSLATENDLASEDTVLT